MLPPAARAAPQQMRVPAHHGTASLVRPRSSAAPPCGLRRACIAPTGRCARRRQQVCGKLARRPVLWGRMHRWACALSHTRASMAVPTGMHNTTATTLATPVHTSPPPPTAAANYRRPASVCGIASVPHNPHTSLQCHSRLNVGSRFTMGLDTGDRHHMRGPTVVCEPCEWPLRNCPPLHECIHGCAAA